jgi:hypothetical protein
MTSAIVSALAGVTSGRTVVRPGSLLTGIADVRGFVQAEGMRGWAEKAVASASNPQSAAAAARLLESAVVYLSADPQGRAAMEVVEAAFPGAKLMFSSIPAGVFQTLASGAANLVTANRKVDVFYRTCATWAAGKHYCDGGWRGAPHPTWIAGRAGTHPITNQIATWCDHDPDNCICLSRDCSDLTLMIGMDPIIKAADIARWVTRWGKVLAIVPNQKFSEFAVRTEKLSRVFSISGDPQPVCLPSGMWYGATGHAALPRWFWQPSKEITWTRQALGAAFMLVEFGPVQRSVPSLVLPGSFFNAVMLGVAPERDVDGYYCIDGAPVARCTVVEEASVALSGTRLTPTAFDTLERTAARLVRERPGDLPIHEEIRAAAETAWALTRHNRGGWWNFSWLTEVATPFPDAFVHGAEGFHRPAIQASLGVLTLVAATMAAGAYRGGTFRIVAGAVASPPSPDEIIVAVHATVTGLERGPLLRRWASYLLSPLFEEGARALSPRVVTATLIATEIAMDYYRGVLEPARFATCGMHLLAHQFAGTKYAYMIHFYWNLAAVFSDCYRLGVGYKEMTPGTQEYFRDQLANSPIAAVRAFVALDGLLPLTIGV